ncbi:MAG: phosphoribosyltransferase [Porticoccaceae bacterium]
MPDKFYISAQDLLDDAFELGLRVFDSGFEPDLIVGVWRGGTPVAIAVHEILACLGVNADHIAVRTSLYRGVGHRNRRVEIQGLDYVIDRLIDDGERIRRLLIVDDVFDTGLSLQRLVADLKVGGGDSLPDIRIAVPWAKPANYLTELRPDYVLHETSAWLVFPHELCGLSRQELLAKPGIDRVRQRLAGADEASETAP